MNLALFSLEQTQALKPSLQAVPSPPCLPNALKSPPVSTPCAHSLFNVVARVVVFRDVPLLCL
jgi:hypothetical protein